MTYTFLFYKLFIINCFTFGGGYTIIPVIKDEFVDKKNLLTASDIDDMIAISQSIPGVLVVSMSFLLGYKLKGYKGAIVAVIASIIPSFVILTIITLFYKEFIKNNIIQFYLKNIAVTVSAILLITVLKMIKNGLNNSPLIFIILFTLCLTLKVFINLSLVYILIISSTLSLILNIIMKKGDN